MRLVLMTCAVVGVVCAGADAAAGELIQQARFCPDLPIRIVPGYPSMDQSWPDRGNPTHIGRHSKLGMVLVEPQVYPDRLRYYADEPTAQVLAILAPQEGGLDGHTCEVAVRSEAGQAVASFRTPAEHHAITFLLDLRELPAGRYIVEAKLVTSAGETASAASATIEKLAQRLGAPTIPDDGIPLRLEDQSFVADGDWPVHVGVPLPRGAVADASELALFENGKRIAADIDTRAYWDPARRSIKWVHVHFVGRYREGQPAEYRLRRVTASDAPPQATLQVREREKEIEIDTGAIRFIVDRQRFNGIESLWRNGKRIIDADDDAGPYLVNQDDVRFDARRDSNVSVELENSGGTEATIVARGWYTAKSGDRLCLFVTRISAFAGQPMLRIRQYTTITYDTNQVQLADLGFALPIRGVKRLAFGADGQLVAPDARDLSLHQETWERFRSLGLKQELEGGKLDGWFTFDTSDGEVHLLVRDLWQKYPKEVALGRDGFTVHFWPRHGRDVFDLEYQLERQNIYKFLCFHQGRLMDLKTPQTYVDRFVEYAADKTTLALEGSSQWWRDSERDGTKSGNAQGVTIANEFALVFPEQDGPAPDAINSLFAFDPTAVVDPAWTCATGALGDTAAPDGKHFTEVEQAIEQGWLSWARQHERYNDYGMFNYADTHTVTNVAENRPGLHRVWQGSHYRNVGTNWLLWARTGSPDLLRWARANTGHYLNIKTTNYVDRENPIGVMDHELGAMQHMGWKTHWASSAHGEAWGQFKDVVGHFIDPDAALWAWLMTADPRGRENYENWLATVKTKFARILWGWAREFNTTHAYLVGAYEATWDPELLPNIYNMALSLRLIPLEKQRPGPLWHPMWINRYYDLTRDPEYEPLIHKYAQMWTGVESSSTLGLAAKSYDLSGDPAILQRMLPSMVRFPRHYFRKPGDPWDWWGMGPGPLGDAYVSMLWGEFRARLERAGITELPPDTEPRGGYPYTSARFNYPNLPASLTLHVLEETDQAFDIRLGLRSMGGSLHATSVKVLNPKGEQVLWIERVNEGDATNQPHTIPADGVTGVYRVEFRGHEAAVPVPQTSLPEAAAIEPGRPYLVLNPRFIIKPAPMSAMTMTVKDFTDRDPAHARVESAAGAVLGEARLFTARDVPSATFDLPADAAPWVFDAVGKAYLQLDGGDGVQLLCGSDARHLEMIAKKLGSP